MNTSDPFLQDLLQQLMSGKMASDTYSELVGQLAVLDNETVSRTLESLWNDYEQGLELSISEKTDMLYRIHQTIKNAKKKKYLWKPSNWSRIATAILSTTINISSLSKKRLSPKSL